MLTLLQLKGKHLLMRVLGIDYGMRRIGLALSDPTETIATPLDTLIPGEARGPRYLRLSLLQLKKVLSTW